MSDDFIEVLYTNHRGETRIRKITPRFLWFGHTNHHPEDQWFLHCDDEEKDSTRDFALKDCNFSVENDTRLMLHASVEAKQRRTQQWGEHPWERHGDYDG